MKEKQYKIGELSKLVNVPVKTIRYYDEIGLLTPSFVDKYSGYRYYDEENLKKLLQILFLKNLDYSLDEIRIFDIDTSLVNQQKVLQSKIAELKNKLHLINSLQKMKGDKIMKPFINDENAIGKWNYVASASSMEGFSNGDSYYDDEIFLKELYFLDNGQGYWFFERWTKGMLFHFSGVIYEYVIKGDKLYLTIYNRDNEFEIILLLEKENSNHYTIDDIKKKDNINLPFVKDDDALGFWESCDFVGYKEKENYIPKETKEELYLKSITIQPNGDCVFDSTNGIFKSMWTKGVIINKNNCTASNYMIKENNGEKYLIMDWKSGDYTFGGKIYGCYVFKKIN